MASVARDRRREADAVFGVAYVVIHRLRYSNNLDAKFVELGRVAERVVTADCNKVLDAEGREVGQHLPGEVPGLAGDATLVTQGDRKVLAGEVIG